MSGTTLTVAGGYNGQTGMVTVPSSLLFGSGTDSTTLNGMLQTYLGTITDGVKSLVNDFQNKDLAAPSGSTVVAGSGSTSFEIFSDTDKDGNTVAGSGNYNATVSAGTTDMMVQAPGNVTLTGTGATTKALFGAGSNVNYTVNDPTAGEIDLLGGANSITLLSQNTTNAETVYSAGNDTINMVGQGADSVTVFGNATLQDLSGNAYVTAEGNATTNFYWNSANAGGTLHFTNNSSVAATIHIGNFNGQTSSTKVTIDGGAGGGFFVGGASGSNSLMGGTGAVTLVGAGSGDYLEAKSGLDNTLFQGSGNETLVATSTTGSNGFYAGLAYPGIGGDPVVSGVISSQGSGKQTYDLGNVPGGESIYGSLNASSNDYIINTGTVPGATIGGGQISIYNFVDSRSSILFEDGAGNLSNVSIVGAAADQFNSGSTNLQYDIKLSDGTEVMIKGLTSAQLNAIHTISVFSHTGFSG